MFGKLKRYLYAKINLGLSTNYQRFIQGGGVQ